jgi:hypothetical protein
MLDMTSICGFHVGIMDVEMDIFIISDGYKFIITDVADQTINVFGPMLQSDIRRFIGAIIKKYETYLLLNAADDCQTQFMKPGMTIEYYPITVDEYLVVGCFDVPHPSLMR